LRDATGIDIGYRRCGVLHVALDDGERAKLSREVAWQAESGLPIERLDADGIARLEPSITALAAFGVHFSEDGVGGPPLLLKALHFAASAAGASFQTGTYVRSVDIAGGVAEGVLLDDGTRIAAPKVVLAAGSWSTLVGGFPEGAPPVRPARGQIVELE